MTLCWFIQCDMNLGTARRTILVGIKVRALGFLHNGRCFLERVVENVTVPQRPKGPLDTC